MTVKIEAPPTATDHWIRFLAAHRPNGEARYDLSQLNGWILFVIELGAQSWWALSLEDIWPVTGSTTADF